MGSVGHRQDRIRDVHKLGARIYLLAHCPESIRVAGAPRYKFRLDGLLYLFSCKSQPLRPQFRVMSDNKPLPMWLWIFIAVLFAVWLLYWLVL